MNTLSQEVTMVTAYFSIDREIRGNGFYFERGLQLFQLTPTIHWYFYTNESEYFLQLNLPNVTVVQSEISHFFPGHDETPLTGLQGPFGGNKEKDTIEYLKIQNSKLNIIQTSPGEVLCWCDFGLIGYVENKTLFASYLVQISQTINIKGFYSPSFHGDITPRNLYCGPIWTFAGGFLIGDRTSIEKFDTEYNKIIKESVKSGLLTWEVNYWHQTYVNNPSLVTLYRCVNHNIHLVENLLSTKLYQI